MPPLDSHPDVTWPPTFRGVYPPGGMGVSDARRLKQLEDENRRLRQAVADLTLDNQALKLVISKKL
jgi:hypothetical protein